MASLSRAEIERLVAYTEWADHRCVRAAARLVTEDFVRDMGASFGSVRGTLHHILACEMLWLERLKGMGSSRLPDLGAIPDVVALRKRWRVFEAHRQSWVEGLRDGDGERVIAYSTVAGEPREGPLAHLLQHATVHSAYHRGQVALLLRLLGNAPPCTDMVEFDRQWKRCT